MFIFASFFNLIIIIIMLFQSKRSSKRKSQIYCYLE